MKLLSILLMLAIALGFVMVSADSYENKKKEDGYGRQVKVQEYVEVEEMAPIEIDIDLEGGLGKKKIKKRRFRTRTLTTSATVTDPFTVTPVSAATITVTFFTTTGVTATTSTTTSEELLVLQSIFQTGEEVENTQGINIDPTTLTDGTRVIWSIEFQKGLSAAVLLSSQYPSSRPPTLHSLSPALLAILQSNASHNFDSLQRALESMWQECRPNGVLYQWIDWIRSDLLRTSTRQKPTDLQDALVADNEPAKDQQEPEQLTSVNPSIEIYSSEEPLVDRKSVFIAHLSPISSVDQIPMVVEELKLRQPRIRRATHNIMAYRFLKPFKSSENKSDSTKDFVLMQDYDDDGETAAGGRLLRLMEMCDCRGVMVIVSRWYGGIQLGPDRFRHINNCAKLLLIKHGYVRENK